MPKLIVMLIGKARGKPGPITWIPTGFTTQEFMLTTCFLKAVGNNSYFVYFIVHLSNWSLNMILSNIEILLVSQQRTTQPTGPIRLAYWELQLIVFPISVHRLQLQLFLWKIHLRHFDKDQEPLGESESCDTGSWCSRALFRVKRCGYKVGMVDRQRSRSSRAI